jgi:peptidoglycan/LPS O-acetylase OafA/YrhL
MSVEMKGDRRTERSAERLPALDGLRGIAIILVLFNHFFPNLNYSGMRSLQWFSNLCQSGWAGVDLFFVLSGFLITGILLSSRRSLTYFSTFFARRFLRIIPLYYALLFFSFVVFPATALCDWSTFAPVSRWQAAHWCFLSNVAMVLDAPVCSPQLCFGHLWSISVEEHFYLVWPFLIYALPEKRISSACLAIMILVPFARGIAVLCDAPHTAFFQSPLRIDALATGALIAVQHRNGTLASYSSRWLALAGVSGAILIAAFFAHRGLPAHHAGMHILGYSLLSWVAAGTVVLAVTRPHGWLARGLGNPVLRFFGQYSYGMYLLHGLLSPWLVSMTPVDTVSSSAGITAASVFGVTALRIGASTVAALISWYLIEQPCLSLKRFFVYRQPQPAVAILPELAAQIPEA